MGKLSAKELAREISDFVNGGRRENIDELVKIMANDHPTLQQVKMGVFVKFIEAMANKPYVDARNQASHDMAKAMIEGFRRASKQTIIDQDGFISDSMSEFIDKTFPSQYLPFI